MSRYSDYKKARKIFQAIEENPERYLIIHYSCESFYNLGGRSPKVASISIRQLNNAQTNNFSIHQYAEILNLPITEETYKEIETQLLKDFYEFMDKKSDKFWVHWNMRDTVFGFHALEHRFRVLGGIPKIIDDEKKVDLAYLFKLQFGGGYIGNPHIEKLIERNDLKPKRFLSGKDEADAFDNARYNELSMSTSSKVNLFSSFITLAIDEKLQTDIPTWKVRGTNLLGLWSTLQSTVIGQIVIWIINLVIGGIVGAIVAKYF